MTADHPRPKGRIYLYLMSGGRGEHRFTNGTFADLEAEGVELKDGMRLRFYSDDGNEKGEPDYLLCDGIARQHPDGTWWATVIDERIWWESDEQPKKRSN